MGQTLIDAAGAVRISDTHEALVLAPSCVCSTSFEQMTKHSSLHDNEAIGNEAIAAEGFAMRIGEGGWSEPACGGRGIDSTLFLHTER
jgi:hypothetical protein